MRIRYPYPVPFYVQPGSYFIWFKILTLFEGDLDPGSRIFLFQDGKVWIWDPGSANIGVSQINMWHSDPDLNRDWIWN